MVEVDPTFTGLGVGGGRWPVAGGKLCLSPQQLNELLRCAVETAAAIEGLALVPDVPAGIAVRQLAATGLRLKAALIRAGAIAPNTGASGE